MHSVNFQSNLELWILNFKLNYFHETWLLFSFIKVKKMLNQIIVGK